MMDSGGRQEKAPACDTSVLVMRIETERLGAVETGTVRVVGVNENDMSVQCAGFWLIKTNILRWRRWLIRMVMVMKVRGLREY